MPAPAVIPALRVYANAAVVKTLVVYIRSSFTSPVVAQLSTIAKAVVLGGSSGVTPLALYAIFGLCAWVGEAASFYNREKIRVLKTGL